MIWFDQTYFNSILNNAQRLYKKAYEMLSAGFIYCKIKGEKE